MTLQASLKEKLESVQSQMKKVEADLQKEKDHYHQLQYDLSHSQQESSTQETLSKSLKGRLAEMKVCRLDRFSSRLW